MSNSERKGGLSVALRQSGTPAGLLFSDASKTRGGRPPTSQPNTSRPADTPSHRGVPRRTSPRDSDMGSKLLSPQLGVPPLEMQRGEQYPGSPFSIRAAGPAWESEALALPPSRSSSVRSASSSSRTPSPPPLIRGYPGVGTVYGASAPFRSQTPTPPSRPSAVSGSHRRSRTTSLSSSQSHSTSTTVHRASPLRAVQHAHSASIADTLFPPDGQPRGHDFPPGREWGSYSTYVNAEPPRASTSYASSRIPPTQYADVRRAPRRPNVDTGVYSPMPMPPGPGSPASWTAPLREATWSPASERSAASAPSLRQPPAVPRREGELKSWQHWYHELSPRDQLQSAQRLVPRDEAEMPRTVSVASLDTSVKTIKEEIEERDMRLKAWKKQRELEAEWAESKREAQERR